MTHLKSLYMVLAVATLGSTTVARAAVVPFSGSITGVGIGSTDITCAPAPARGVLSPSTSTGVSNLGNFTYGHNWCFYGPSGPINGTFGLNFGTSTLYGAVTGLATPTTTTGLTDLALTYSILGGTGLYTGATGSFGGLATADVRAGNGSHFSLNFLGSINVAAVPEPGTWLMMVLGFASIGFAMRRSRSTTGEMVQVA